MSKRATIIVIGIAVAVLLFVAGILITNGIPLF